MSSSLDYSSLKARQRAERSEWPTNLGLRVHRALSWLNRAEQCEDQDGRFIFHWIAFNAAYANEILVGERLNEQEIFGQFLQKLVDLDKNELLYGLIWAEFSSSVRVLLANRYVFQPFWDYQNDKISEQEWLDRFENANAAAGRALANQRTRDVLAVVLSRMYTLRNQLLHGGATWDSSVNREQLRDCSAFLGKLVPTIIQLMMDNPDTLWGDACYPVVDG